MSRSIDWHSMTADDVLLMWNSGVQGLSNREARRRLKIYGPNVIEKHRRQSLGSLFLSQFKDPMVLMLLVATLVSGFLGEMVDAVVIMIIVILNASLGSLQEFKAEKSLETLENLAPPDAVVVRHDHVTSVPRESVVPGDVLVLRPGNRIAADARLIESRSLQCEEAALSGESLPLSKDASYKCTRTASVSERKNMVYAGTMVSRGEGLAVVVATGMNTEMGHIAHLVSSATPQPTPLQRKLSGLGKTLIFTCTGLCSLLVAVGILRGTPVHRMILVGVSLAVAAIPEGLPAVVTLCFAIGVQRMARKNCVVRKLAAIEALGSVTVICTDKTGTLTFNEMRVAEIGVLGGAGERTRVTTAGSGAYGVILAGLLASDARHLPAEGESTGEDPTEQAIVREAGLIGIDVGNVDRDFPRVLEKPFSPERRMMSVLVQDGADFRVCCKGAPDTVIPLCTYQMDGGEKRAITGRDRQKWEEWVEAQAGSGRRVLAIATRTEKRSSGQYSEYSETDLCLLGCMALEDPLRPEAEESVLTCLRAGIRPVLITGDHLKTAENIGRRCGILNEGGSGITGEFVDRLPLREIPSVCEAHPVLGRVSPAQKLKIVKGLKTGSHVVAMTGDGVNDAPALKEAAVGIAMGKVGTDVAREASSMVIMDDNFRTIVAAIEEGRAIYDNIRKFIRYLFSCNLGEIITVGVATVAGLPMPLSATQLLWVNLVTDGLPALALSTDPPVDNVMKRPPRDPKEGMFSRGLAKMILGRGLYIGLVTLLVFLSKAKDGDFAVASTLAYATLVTSQLVTAFDCRSEERSITVRDIFVNPYLLGACLLSWSMLYATIHVPWLSAVFRTVPLGITEWILVVFASILPDVAVQAFSGKKGGQKS